MLNKAAFSPAQHRRLLHPPALSLPRQPLRPGMRLVPSKAAASEEARRVDLVHLVCFVHLVGLVQPNKRDKPNKPNNSLLTLADFFSILLSGFRSRHHTLASSACFTRRPAAAAWTSNGHARDTKVWDLGSNTCPSRRFLATFLRSSPEATRQHGSPASSPAFPSPHYSPSPNTP